ncbi:MAG: response regulator transcription factor [Bacteroidales bacterium]|nr:response regulator transcription factor [Bacteroidales bacterium]MCF8457359.1 response regulator transcription factor [Bacteroidales bacterium]
MKVLVVEDEPKVSAFIKQGLEEHGYEVDIAYDGSIGERMALKGNYNIILLDVIIPYQNGIELCKKIRAEDNEVPILMLSALGTTDDKLIGFDVGVDDYLVKPFNFSELLARIKALTKRGRGISQKANTLQVANLQLSIENKEAIRDNKKIDLTAKEFSLLEYLMRNQGKVLTRMEIAENVWDIKFDTGTNVVDVYINILRKKIDKDFDPKLIKTRIGMGYVISDT